MLRIRTITSILMTIILVMQGPLWALPAPQSSLSQFNSLPYSGFLKFQRLGTPSQESLRLSNQRGKPDPETSLADGLGLLVLVGVLSGQAAENDAVARKC